MHAAQRSKDYALQSHAGLCQASVDPVHRLNTCTVQAQKSYISRAWNF